MRSRQRRKRKGEGDKEEDDEERNSDEEEVPVSLLQQFGERVSHKHYGKHLLSVGDLDNIDVALFVVAASCIKKAIKRWKTSQLPVKAEEELGEAGDEPHAQQHSPRARRQTAGGRRKKTPRQSQSLPSTRPETATLLATASSIRKGETMEDTIRMLAAYADAIVLRHPEEGSAARAAAVVDSRVDATGICCVINAGDGAGEHPTQALLDIFTIAELFPEWWAEQLQRLNTKDEQQEHLPDEKEKSEESSDALKKENKGAGVMQQEREEAGAMDNQHQQQTAFPSAKEEDTSISGDEQTGGLFQKMVEAGRGANAAAEAAAAAAAAAVQSSGSSSSQDVTASDTTPTAAAEEKPPGPRKLTVAFVGDLKHGRTVHSLALVLSKFNCRIIALSSTELRLPDALEITITKNFTAQGGDGRGRLVHGTDFAETIRAADVLYMTRMQTERSVNPVAGESLSTQAQHSFVLTKTLLEAHAKPHVKVLHPLPRVNEIDTTVDTTPFCAYFTQAENGLYMRMALLAVALNPYAWQLLFGV